MKRFLIPLGLFLVLLVFLGAGLGRDPRVLPSPLIGRSAPAFALARLDDPGASVSSRDMLGKVWMLNVWASWCASCQIEHPLLLAFSRNAGIPLIGLNYKDGRAEGTAWLRRHGNPYLASAFDQDGRTGIDYGVYGVPETFLIDRRGIVRYRHAGPLTQEVLKRDVLPMIEALNRA